jgi:hypothetical protein
MPQLMQQMLLQGLEMAVVMERGGIWRYWMDLLWICKGGRVGFSNGSSGQDYWITVQEMYDNAGGEAGTGLGLIDFANKYFPKMANGGRVGYA